jgi:hypothetical protein
MSLPTNLKTAIFFETPIGESGYAIRYSWPGNGHVAISLQWKSRPDPQQAGLIRLNDLRKIVETFEALQKGHYLIGPPLPDVDMTEILS